MSIYLSARLFLSVKVSASWFVICLPTCLPTDCPTYLSACLNTYPHTYLSVCLHVVIHSVYYQSACLPVCVYLFAIHLSVCYESSCYLYTYVRTLPHVCLLYSRPSVYCISACLTERSPFSYLAACLPICFLPTYLPKATLLATYLLTWLSVCLSISMSICLHAYSTNGSQASSLDAHFRNKEKGGRVGSQAHIRIAKNSISHKKNVDNGFCLETSDTFHTF